MSDISSTVSGLTLIIRTTKASPQSHHAVLTGLTDVVETLIEAGADVNAESLDYGTPLHLAALKDRSDVADLLHTIQSKR